MISPRILYTVSHKKRAIKF